MNDLKTVRDETAVVMKRIHEDIVAKPTGIMIELYDFLEHVRVTLDRMIETPAPQGNLSVDILASFSAYLIKQGVGTAEIDMSLFKAIGFTLKDFSHAKEVNVKDRMYIRKAIK